MRIRGMHEKLLGRWDIASRCASPLLSIELLHVELRHLCHSMVFVW